MEQLQLTMAQPQQRVLMIVITIHSVVGLQVLVRLQGRLHILLSSLQQHILMRILSQQLLRLVQSKVMISMSVTGVQDMCIKITQQRQGIVGLQLDIQQVQTA